MARLWRAFVAAGIAAGAAGTVLGGCFSEREATAPASGECRFPLGEGVAGSTVVVIRDFSFEPVEVRVRAGERVTWINCGQDEHTSAADGGQWASALLAAGDAFTRTFDVAGEFSYHCNPHPFMAGRVIVE